MLSDDSDVFESPLKKYKKGMHKSDLTNFYLVSKSSSISVKTSQTMHPIVTKKSDITSNTLYKDSSNISRKGSIFIIFLISVDVVPLQQQNLNIPHAANTADKKRYLLSISDDSDFEKPLRKKTKGIIFCCFCANNPALNAACFNAAVRDDNVECC